MKRKIILISIIALSLTIATAYLIWQMNRGAWPLLTPSEITFTNSQGKAVTMLAYPGEVYVAFKPGIEVSSMQSLISQLGGTIQEQISDYGIYFIKVPVGKEAETIGQLLKNQSVFNASLNEALAIQGSILENFGPIRLPFKLSGIAFAATQKECKVIIAQLDDFIGSNMHGKEVKGVIESITGSQPIEEVQVGVGCGRMVCRPTPDAETQVARLATLIDKAKNNQQEDIKLTVNISLGIQIPNIHSESGLNTFTAAENTQRLNAWKEDIKKTLDVLVASKWAQEHVLINLATGNGSNLYNNKTSALIKSIGLDVGPAINELKNNPTYGPILKKNILFYGASDANDTPTSYSNYGNGVLYTREPADPSAEGKTLQGTSFATPQGTGLTYNTWNADCSLSASQIKEAVTNSAKSVGQFNILNVSELKNLNLLKEKKPEVTSPPTSAPTPISPVCDPNGNATVYSNCVNNEKDLEKPMQYETSKEVEVGSWLDWPIIKEPWEFLKDIFSGELISDISNFWKPPVSEDLPVPASKDCVLDEKAGDGVEKFCPDPSCTPIKCPYGGNYESCVGTNLDGTPKRFTRGRCLSAPTPAPVVPTPKPAPTPPPEPACVPRYDRIVAAQKVCDAGFDENQNNFIYKSCMDLIPIRLPGECASFY